MTLAFLAAPKPTSPSSTPSGAPTETGKRKQVRRDLHHGTTMAATFGRSPKTVTSPSPRHGRPMDGELAYTTYRTGNADVYVYDLNTGKMGVVAAFPGMNGAPSWSPTGGQIALTLSRDGNPEIYRIQSNGSNPMRITRARSVETSPTWTPDGSQISFHLRSIGIAEDLSSLRKRRKPNPRSPPVAIATTPMLARLETESSTPPTKVGAGSIFGFQIWAVGMPST